MSFSCTKETGNNSRGPKQTSCQSGKSSCGTRHLTKETAFVCGVNFMRLKTLQTDCNCVLRRAGKRSSVKQMFGILLGMKNQQHAAEASDQEQLRGEGNCRMPSRQRGAEGSGVCPACRGRTLIEIRGKLQCDRCHTICETCCEGGRC